MQEQSEQLSSAADQALHKSRSGSWAAEREDMVSFTFLVSPCFIRESFLTVNAVFLLSGRVCSEMCSCMQDSLQKRDHIVDIHALGTTAGPTRLDLAYAVQLAIAAIAIFDTAICSQVSSMTRY